ncbi:MAG: family 16 glycoside hydrolase [Phycisphaerae bacterium]
MTSIVSTFLAAAAACSLGLAAGAENASSGTSSPIKALLITGHNNHNWKYTSRVHAETLEATGRFEVTITDDPAATLADAAAVSAYQVFVLDYNDMQASKRWGESADRNFEAAVKGGTGVVAIHSANNAFKGWAEYERMLGLMWRDGTGHGQYHAFDVTWTDPGHPITKGMPAITRHKDELYHNLVNSQHAEYTLLAKAFSDKATGGTGKDEPMGFTLSYGKGRVFATPLGHVWENAIETKGTVCDPQFRTFIARGAEWAATGEVTLGPTWQDVRRHNTLSAQEQAAGWTLLFDGTSATGLRGFRKQAMPGKGWTIADGELRVQSKGGGGDLATAEEYADFEFACDWKAAPGANSGIMYRCDEKHDYPWLTGPEMQVLDDAGHPDGKKPQTRAGTLYDIIPCAADVARPAGEWNHARVVAKGTRLQHFLNGIKVVDIDTASDEYKDAWKKSKWPSMPTYGTTASGHICLQDHGDDVAFRNIKVRRLK